MMDEVWDDFPHLTTTELRNALGAYLFKGDEVFKQISLLSGGEKCRINLLKLMLQEDNFLLLDEPTNHLDIPSREALEDSLMDYDGTMLVISHDRYFLNKVVNKIFDLKETGINQYLGNYSYYLEKRQPEIKTSDKKEPDSTAKTRQSNKESPDKNAGKPISRKSRGYHRNRRFDPQPMSPDQGRGFLNSERPRPSWLKSLMQTTIWRN